MAKLTELTLGGVSGRVGDLVFARYTGKVVIRSRPRPKKDNPTPKQVVRREKFTLANSLASRFKPFFNRIKSINPELEPRKEFFSRVFLAISESSTGLLVDYSKLEFSRGPVEKVEGFSAQLSATNALLTWNSGDKDRQNDTILILAFGENPDSPHKIEPILFSKKRHEGKLELSIPSSWHGNTIHFYSLAYTDKGKLSDTSYSCLPLLVT